MEENLSSRLSDYPTAEAFVADVVIVDMRGLAQLRVATLVLAPERSNIAEKLANLAYRQYW